MARDRINRIPVKMTWLLIECPGWKSWTLLVSSGAKWDVCQKKGGLPSNISPVTDICRNSGVLLYCYLSSVYLFYCSPTYLQPPLQEFPSSLQLQIPPNTEELPASPQKQQVTDIETVNCHLVSPPRQYHMALYLSFRLSAKPVSL